LEQFLVSSRHKTLSQHVVDHSPRANNNHRIVITIGKTILTMAKRKRHAPATSKAISQQQAWVTYVPAKRLRNQALSMLEAAKLEAAISNDPSHG
jgi:hypothetical protein